MWTCPKCSNKVGAGLEVCRNCGTFRDAAEDAGAPTEPDPPKTAPIETETQRSQPSDLSEQPDPSQATASDEDHPESRQPFDWLAGHDQEDASEGSSGWVCTGCGETVPGHFDVCWKCQTPKWAGADAGPRDKRYWDAISDAIGEQGDEVDTRLPSVGFRGSAGFRVFRGRWSSWQELFQQAARFAGSMGPDRVISISHSADQGDGVVVVWYWSK